MREREEDAAILMPLLLAVAVIFGIGIYYEATMAIEEMRAEERNLDAAEYAARAEAELAAAEKAVARDLD